MPRNRLRLSETENGSPEGRLIQITCFNVGQGNSLLVQIPGETPDKPTVVGIIDCFKRPHLKEPLVLSRLKALGIRRLDFVVLTHPDADHCTGLSQVLEYFSTDGREFGAFIECIFDCETLFAVQKARGRVPTAKLSPKARELYAIYQSVVAMGKRLGAQFNYEALGHYSQDLQVAPELNFKFVAPDNNAAKKLKARLIQVGGAICAGTKIPTFSLNSLCLAFQIQYAKARILICGDVDHSVWKRVIPVAAQNKFDLRSDFVLVTHHGSGRDNPEFLWRNIRRGCAVPTIAVISCGYKNKHKHPHDATLRRALDGNVSLLCTNLGYPCQGLAVVSGPNTAEKALAGAFGPRLTDPLARIARKKLGRRRPAELCSGTMDFEISREGIVRVLRREQDSICAYANVNGLSNPYPNHLFAS